MHKNNTVTRKAKRAQAMQELLTAIRRLINIAFNKLVEFRRLFGYKMSQTKQSIREVVIFYSRKEHPGEKGWVPPELVRAMAILGLHKFTRAKAIGEAKKAGKITDPEQVIEQMLPRRQARHRKNRSPHLKRTHVFSRHAHSIHPYWSPETMAVQ